MPTQLLDNIVNWGNHSGQVRAMLLTSSRANNNAPRDMFTDYDIEFAVSNQEEFLRSDDWLNNFGKPIAIIAEGIENFDGKYAMRMVFYEDHTKVDFRIYALEKFAEQTQQPVLFRDWDIGYKILIDKDGLTRKIPSPTYSAFNICKPSKKEFENVLTDFWWDTSYVAKSLWRDEIFYAKYMLDDVIRFQYIQKLVEWYIGFEHSWNITTNKHGRLFRKYLSAKMYQKLEATFADAGIENNWAALLNCCELVRIIGVPLAAQLGFNYPNGHDLKFTKYLEWIRQQPKPHKPGLK